MGIPDICWSLLLKSLIISISFTSYASLCTIFIRQETPHKQRDGKLNQRLNGLSLCHIHFHNYFIIFAITGRRARPRGTATTQATMAFTLDTTAFCVTVNMTASRGSPNTNLCSIKLFDR